MAKTHKTQSNTVKKPKVATTNRIQITLDKCIYCSSDITREVRDLTVRLGQKLFPKAGERNMLIDKLRALAKESPEHFANSSLQILTPTYMKIPGGDHPRAFEHLY